MFLTATLVLTALQSPIDASLCAKVEVRGPAPALVAHALSLAGFEVEGCGAALTRTGVELIVTPEELALLEKRGFNVRVRERGRPLADILAAREPNDGVVPGGYLDLAAIEQALATYASTYPTLAQVVDLTARFGAPLTFGGRSLKALKVSDNVTVDEDEPAFLLVSAHHCREIVTPVIALDSIERLLAGYAGNPALRTLVDTHEIWIVPVWNPDGYHHVFTVDNLWRKNRRPFPGGTGVDLNRNYPFLWNTACAGSSSTSSSTYRGPFPGSEAETAAMAVFSLDRHFAKVLDFHSSGRETLWGYACPTSPLDNFWRAEAIALSNACGYSGVERRPSADGEHYHWQFANTGAMAFLTETHSQFQPTYVSAQAEAAQVWPGVRQQLERPMPLAGHVRDACSGAPLAATITYLSPIFTQGESNRSNPRFGRYHAFLPPGTHSLRFEAPGYVTQVIAVTINSGTTTTREVALDPVAGGGTVLCNATPNSTGVVPTLTLVGSTSLAANQLAFQASGLPANQPTTLLLGTNFVSTPQFNGTLCIARPRPAFGIVQSGANGTVMLPADFVRAGLVVGETFGAQGYFRDPAAGGGTRNFTPALSLTVCP